MVDDARARQLVLLNHVTDGLLAANMLKSDGATPLTTHSQYTSPEIPHNWVFNGTGNDAIFTLDSPTSEPLADYNHKTYAYIENVPITIWVKDGPTVNGRAARWQCEAELRRVIENSYSNTYGALRRFKKILDNEQDMGAWRLFSVKYDLEYKRKADNYTPTYPTFGFGTGWNFDGDRTSGGVEGTWTVSGAAATQAIDSGDYFALTRAAADASTVNGTNLSLSTSIYTKIRFRYKCGNSSVKAKIIVTFSDASTQTVLAETNNQTFGYTSVALTAAKTVDHVTLYATTAAGTVYYDFVEIYEGDYILPNCTKLTPPNILRDASLKPFGMIGAHTQAGGAELKTVTMSCDLDVEGATITWKRPQTGSPTDKTNTEVFELIAHEEAKNVPWHWLDWGRGAMKVRLTQFTPNLYGDNTLDLEWTEYRLSSAGVSHENYRTRTSMDQVA
jgi:hypothetical protein